MNDERQEKRFLKTKARLKQWENQTEYFRMFSQEAAKLIPDNSLDWVYVDARHDYCGVMEDIVNYWPKVR
jgi:hypothetical protein